MNENKIVVLHQDKNIIVCIKPAGISSEDGDGVNMVSLLREQTGKSEIFAVHRLDLPTSGIMVYAANKKSAADLSKQITDGIFGKEYLCVVSGKPDEPHGRMTDLLYFDRTMGKSFTVERERKGVKTAELDYELLGSTTDERGNLLSLMRMKLITGRTHQIRVQCASRGMPVVNDRKYGSAVRADNLALLSQKLTFCSSDGQELTFETAMPDSFPWNLFI